MYLGELTASCPSGAHIERHAAIVLEAAEVRRLRQVHVEGIAKIDDRGTTRDQAYEFSSARLAEVAVRKGRTGPVPFDRVMQEAFERIEKTATSGRRISGLETGYRDLDTMTAGLHPGQLIIIAAVASGILIASIFMSRQEKRRQRDMQMAIAANKIAGP